jgi:hypothetical protein
MKITYYLILLLIFFLTLVINLLADNVDDEKILYQLIERARFVGDIMNHGEPTDFQKIFKPYKENLQKIAIHLMLDDVDNTSPKKQTDDKNPQQETTNYEGYRFNIYNQSEETIFPLNTLMISMQKTEQQPDRPSSSPFVGFYWEGGAARGIKFFSVAFYKNGNPRQLEIQYVAKEPMTSLVEWNDKDEITVKKNLHYLSEQKIVVPYSQRANEKQNIKTDKTFIKIRPINIPKTNDKNVRLVFERIKFLAESKKPSDLASIFQWKLVNKEALGSIHFTNGIVRDIQFTSYSNRRGYYLSLDNKGRIIAYAEGVIDGVKNEKQLDKFYEERDGDRPSFQCGFFRTLLGKGIEIEFHPNGYPSTYRTIVRDRLYGKQLEWNDKGEVILDVDLDIPKEWKDAPKKVEPQPK